MQRHAHRSSKELSDSCLHRLNVYALAAGAAGVGMLALAPPAEAEIVFTPAHSQILRHGHLLLDLTHNGKPNFEIAQRSGCTTDGGFGTFCTSEVYVYVPFYGNPGNFAVGQKLFPFHAYALQAGEQIGPKQAWGGYALNHRARSGDSLGSCTGSWNNVANRYLGLRFVVAGETHFGWARLNASCSPTAKVVATLTGYAYETVPNQPIIAGDTGGAADAPAGDSPSAKAESSGTYLIDPLRDRFGQSLGLLAVGAPALPVWRRKEPATAAN